jgi:hypothetical protein
MAEAEPTLTRHDLEAKIVKHCWEDDEFRREFTADPAGAFVKHLQVPAASLPKIVIHEEPAGTWHIVLPLRPANADELSERDLERVAGGQSFIVSNTPAISFVSAAVATITAGLSGIASASAMVSLNEGW